MQKDCERERWGGAQGGREGVGQGKEVGQGAGQHAGWQVTRTEGGDRMAKSIKARRVWGKHESEGAGRRGAGGSTRGGDRTRQT